MVTSSWRLWGTCNLSNLYKSSLWNMEYVARGGAFERPRIYRTSIYNTHHTMYVYTCIYLHHYVPGVVGASTCHESCHNSVCCKHLTITALRTLRQLECIHRRAVEGRGGEGRGEGESGEVVGERRMTVYNINPTFAI